MFQSKGASLLPIRHLHNVQGLVADTFNLSSRAIFDLSFNRALLRIFLLLLIDDARELSSLAPQQEARSQVFVKEPPSVLYDQLRAIFPLQYARSKIDGFSWEAQELEEAKAQDVEISWLFNPQFKERGGAGLPGDVDGPSLTVTETNSQNNYTRLWRDSLEERKEPLERSAASFKIPPLFRRASPRHATQPASFAPTKASRTATGDNELPLSTVRSENLSENE